MMIGLSRKIAGALALGLAIATHTADAQTAPLPAPDTAPALAPIDPARLALAHITVDHIFPIGTYARLMNGSITAMMDKMMGGMSQLPLRDIAAIGGAKPEDIAKLDKATLADIMAIIDPAYQQRTTVMMHTMFAEMVPLMSQLEPGIRDGIAEAYARKFTAEQLAEINRFFATPTGNAYASNALLLQADPAVMSKMQGMVPLLMEHLPAIMKDVGDATAKLPKMRKFDDLNPDEKARLAHLLGMTEADLEKSGTQATPAEAQNKP